MDGDAKLPDFGKPKTIDNVLSRFAVSRPDAPALIFSGGEVLNYGALAAQVALLRERLLSHGVRATDRVALMVPRGGDGPPMLKHSTSGPSHRREDDMHTRG